MFHRQYSREPRASITITQCNVWQTQIKELWQVHCFMRQHLGPEQKNRKPTVFNCSHFKITRFICQDKITSPIFNLCRRFCFIQLFNPFFPPPFLPSFLLICFNFSHFYLEVVSTLSQINKDDSKKCQLWIRNYTKPSGGYSFGYSKVLSLAHNADMSTNVYSKIKMVIYAPRDRGEFIPSLE